MIERLMFQRSVIEQMLIPDISVPGKIFVLKTGGPDCVVRAARGGGGYSRGIRVNICDCLPPLRYICHPFSTRVS